MRTVRLATGSSSYEELRPAFEDQRVVCIGGGKSAKIGETLDEALVVGDDRVDLSLDQHDLGDPYAVRVASATPGEVAAVFIVPIEETPTESLRVRAGVAWTS